MPTFAKAAEIVLAIHAVNWKPGSRSEETWRSSLRDYALPRLGSMRVDAVTHCGRHGRAVAHLVDEA